VSGMTEKNKAQTIVRIKLVNGDEYTFNQDDGSMSFGGEQVVIYEKDKKRMTYIPWSAILTLTIETTGVK